MIIIIGHWPTPEALESVAASLLRKAEEMREAEKADTFWFNIGAFRGEIRNISIREIIRPATECRPRFRTQHPRPQNMQVPGREKRQGRSNRRLMDHKSGWVKR